MGDLGSQVVQNVRCKLPSDLPQLDASALERLKQQALETAKRLQQQAIQTASQSAQHANAVARDVASSRSAGEARNKLWVALKNLDSSDGFAAFARVLVCLYFLNVCYEDWENWRRNSTPDMRLQWALSGLQPPAFPWVEVLILMPCAVIAACGVKVMWTGMALVADMVIDNFHMIVSQLIMFLVWGQKPNELVVKKLSMFGCAALVLAHSVRNRIPANSYAGLLLQQGDRKKQIGAGKSVVLLIGRLLMASLFLFVGVTQLERVIARDWVLYAQHDFSVPASARLDGHDNNWLLLEFLLAIPFAIGFKTEVVSRLLAMTMVAEAVTCWNFLANYWPSWQYVSHVRSHFATNLGVAGGLMLLQTFGAGRYTVDALIAKKKQ